MRLLIDIGNTRIKWAYADPAQLFPGEAMNLIEWQLLIENNDWLSTEVTERPSEVVVTSVADETLVDKLCVYAKQNWHCKTRKLLVRSQWQQLKNAYTSPQQMGTDRWMAMVAAWTSCNGACLVMDCGTAITVDAIDAQGQHLGGHIVPGMGLLQQVLSKETAAVRPKRGSQSATRLDNLKTSFADNTTAAVKHGNLSMIGDYLHNCWHRFQQENPSVTLFITGGDGQQISDLLQHSKAYQRDLVLQGMFLVAAKEVETETTKDLSGEQF